MRSLSEVRESIVWILKLLFERQLQSCTERIRLCHEVQWGAQRASRVVLGTSGLHARGEGERVLALDHGAGAEPGDPKAQRKARPHGQAFAL